MIDGHGNNTYILCTGTHNYIAKFMFCYYFCFAGEDIKFHVKELMIVVEKTMVAKNIRTLCNAVALLLTVVGII